MKKVYIDFGPILSDEDSIFKYISSDRSDGKTTGIIRTAYDVWRETGLCGVIARRFSTEITTLYCETMLTNLRKVRPDCGKLTYKGSPKKDGVQLFADGNPIAVCVPLSRAYAIKSSLDVATHKNLYVDEYVPLNGRYLPKNGDVPAILEIYRTIDRDTFTNFCLISSNHISLSNPVFSYFNVVPRNGISRWKNGRFILLQVANKGNREQIRNSPFGELVAGTPYEEYTQGGAITETAGRIQPQHERGRLPFGIECGNAIYAVYFAPQCKYVLDRIATQETRIYSVEPNGGAKNGIYLKSNAAQGVLRMLRAFYQNSLLYFANDAIDYDCEKLKRLLR